MYRLPVHYDRIRQAVDTMPCPVIANGHVYSAAQAQELLARTGARGLMIGRGVIRSPWLFNQIRQQLRGETVTLPTGRDVADYIRALWDSQAMLDKPEKVAVRADEEVPELSRRGRAGAVPAPDSPHADRGGLPPHLRASSSITTSRWRCRRRS